MADAMDDDFDFEAAINEDQDALYAHDDTYDENEVGDVNRTQYDPYSAAISDEEWMRAATPKSEADGEQTLAELTGIPSPKPEDEPEAEPVARDSPMPLWVNGKPTSAPTSRNPRHDEALEALAHSITYRRKITQQAYKRNPAMLATAGSRVTGSAADARQYIFDRPPITTYSNTDSDTHFDDCMEIKLGNGDLCYLGVTKQPSAAVEGAGRSPAQQVGDLLPVPIAELNRQLEKILQQERQAALAKSHSMLKEVDRLLNGDVDDSVLESDAAVGALLSAQEEALAAPSAAVTIQSALWVDKYAPQSFQDLLSPEQVNRNVLKWIKLWDKRVFGTKADSSAVGYKRTHSKISGSNTDRNDMSAGKRSKTASGVEDSSLFAKPSAPLDASKTFGFAASGGAGSHNREDSHNDNWPKFQGVWKMDAKVLLLCGPPGMGKTTLAHIAAKQAGYRPVEINASDDRSSKTIRERIADAQGMQSVFGEKKPTLIILDEIDGMEGGPNGGISELVKMIKATPSLLPRKVNNTGALHGKGDSTKKKGDGDDDEPDEMQQDGAAPKAAANANNKRANSSAAAAGKRNADANDGEESATTVQPLTRPLICICNDQYAPALRELRPLVQVVEFGKTSSERLTSRLKAICRAEGLLVTSDALHTLVQLTDCDIRGSLNTLQFIKFQRNTTNTTSGKFDKSGQPIRVTSDMIVKAAVGVRDQTKALYDVWSAIFRKPDMRLRSNLALSSLGMSGVTTTTTAAATTTSVSAASTHTGGRNAGISLAAATSMQTYVSDLITAVGAYTTDARMFLSGLFENIPEARASDPTMLHTWHSLDLVCFGEELSQRAHETQAYALTKYLPVVAVGVHMHLSADLTTKVKWPRNDAAFRSARDHKQNIIATFLAGGGALNNGACGGFSKRTAVLDVLGYLLCIVSPMLRPVSFGLMNTREKREASDLVQTMASLGLSYVAKATHKHRHFFRQAAPEDLHYVLQPEIQSLVEYEGYNPWDGELRHPLPDIIKHLLTHEVRQARIRALHKRDTPENSGSSAEMAPHLQRHLQTMTGTGETPTAATAPLPTTIASKADIELTQLSEKAALVAGVLAQAAQQTRAAEIARKRDNIAAAQATRSTHEAFSAIRGKYPVVYKFQEGFTNAVRRPVHIKDFL